MTSRTTPVGVLVLALAGLLVMGCNAQTSAVFEALLGPGTGALSTSEGEPAGDAATSSPEAASWWPHPEGYAMLLPAGWAGAAVDADSIGRLMEPMSASNPALAARVQGVLDATGARVSAIAGDASSSGELAPILVVLAQPTEGKKPHEIKQDIKKQISLLPGLVATPLSPKDAGLATARGWRFDYSISDPDLGVLIVRSYLFRFGPNAFLVNFVASEAIADEADAIFDQIAESLRFGI